jgi:hypothetical protein
MESLRTEKAGSLHRRSPCQARNHAPERAGADDHLHSGESPRHAQTTDLAVLLRQFTAEEVTAAVCKALRDQAISFAPRVRVARKHDGAIVIAVINESVKGSQLFCFFKKYTTLPIKLDGMVAELCYADFLVYMEESPSVQTFKCTEEERVQLNQAGSMLKGCIDKLFESHSLLVLAAPMVCAAAADGSDRGAKIQLVLERTDCTPIHGKMEEEAPIPTELEGVPVIAVSGSVRLL